MKEGKILSTAGGVYKVYIDGDILSCLPLGSFRKNNIKPLVGDNVLVNMDKLTIEEIKPRINTLTRPKMANLDLALVVTSLKKPDFSYELLNMFLSFLSLHEIKASIVFSKTDLVDKVPTDLKKHYEDLGYKCYFFSKEEKVDEELENLIKKKTVALVGQTGAGKSTLINALYKDAKQSIGSYSLALGRGKHETTQTIILPFEGNYLCDTPGFSSIELNCYKEDLAIYFPGFKKYHTQCFYSNCLHLSERKCAIKKALEDKEVSQIDYDTYVSLLNNLPYRKDRYDV